MAYITAEEVKAIRNELKAAFPKFKLSVTREHASVLNVHIMEGPVKFVKNYQQVNHYYLNSYEHRTLLKLIREISMRNNFDKSDLQADYHHVGYYFHLGIGKWDKEYKCTNPEAMEPHKDEDRRSRWENRQFAY